MAVQLSGAPPARRLYAETDMAQVECYPMAGGTVCVYSCRAPGKDTVNEDSVAVVETGPDSGLIAVADGAGGFRVGEVASRIALQAVLTARDEAADGTARDAIITGIENANGAVLDLGLGAATTMAVMEIQGRSIRIYHVGDSMALVVGQRGRIKLQTVSHSPTGYAVEAGYMDEDEAITHEERHLVSNLIGSQDMRLELGSALTLAPRDTALVASDGLFDNLLIQEISDSIRTGPIEHALDGLVSKAHARMTEARDGAPSKPDDMSVVLFRPA